MGARSTPDSPLAVLGPAVGEEDRKRLPEDSQAPGCLPSWGAPAAASCPGHLQRGQREPLPRRTPSHTHCHGEEDGMENSACDFAFRSKRLPALGHFPQLSCLIAQSRRKPFRASGTFLSFAIFSLPFERELSRCGKCSLSTSGWGWVEVRLGGSVAPTPAPTRCGRPLAMACCLGPP